MYETRATRDGDVNRYSSTLTLRNLHQSVGESYQCIVSNEFGRAFSEKAYINVYGKLDRYFSSLSKAL